MLNYLLIKNLFLNVNQKRGGNIKKKSCETNLLKWQNLCFYAFMA
jgi:hypothetical protein